MMLGYTTPDDNHVVTNNLIVCKPSLLLLPLWLMIEKLTNLVQQGLISNEPNDLLNDRTEEGLKTLSYNAPILGLLGLDDDLRSIAGGRNR